MRRLLGRTLVGAMLSGSATLALPTGLTSQVLDFDFFSTSEVLTVFDNRGIFLQDPRTSGGLALFPADSPNNYGFGSGLWLGGVRAGERKKVVSTAYDAAGGFSEFVPGRAPVNGGGGDRILCSDDPGELADWYPEFSDPRTGEPAVLSDRDCVVIYNDANQSRTVTIPIGLEVRQRTLQFDQGLLAQALLVVWDMVNTGQGLKRAYFGVIADMDIGAIFQDDRCSAVAPVPRGTAAVAFRNGIGLCWDDDFFEPGFDPNPPGFTGLVLFRGPVGIEGIPLPMTSFTLTSNPAIPRPQPDPMTDIEQYDLLAGIGTRAPFVDPVPTDQRFVAISGPFPFLRGDVQRVVAAYVWADVSNGRTRLPVSEDRCFPSGLPCFLPWPEHPALEELQEVQRAADVVVRQLLSGPVR